MSQNSNTSIEGVKDHAGEGRRMMLLRHQKPVLAQISSRTHTWQPPILLLPTADTGSSHKWIARGLAKLGPAVA